MNVKRRIVILNATCLEVLERNRAWAESFDIELAADISFQHLREDQVDTILDRADVLLLPASIRGLPYPEHMERHRSIRALSIAASGYDWLDVEAATRHGIVVANAPCLEFSEAVADLTFGLILAVVRQIPHHDRVLRSGGYERGMGTSLSGKTLGIVGLGHIGKAVAQRARGFGMKILATTPHPDPAVVRKWEIEVVSLDELLQRSDFVSLHVRLNHATKEMIGAAKLALMKPAAYFINTARPQLADENALTDALVAGRIAGAGLDDPLQRKDSPLLKLPNVVITPHLGNRTWEGMNAAFRCAIENAVAVLDGGRPQYLVNPEVYATPQLRIAQENTT
ncbi:MAG: hypothetical protein HY360_07055 [Verrucomicrobia bacterium]|nr:hypothetical protein [Verrucomicrobiota bacterium]